MFKPLALILALTPMAAHANIFQVQLGQNANLSPGQTALVQAPGYTSVITCNGAVEPPMPEEPQLPENIFFREQTIDLPRDYHKRDEANARAICEMGIEHSTVVPASKKLINDATNECLISYRNCKQLGTTVFSYVPKHRNRGEHGCKVKVQVRGE
jgi:hypothetical protein